jgi:hypothetical protein
VPCGGISNQISWDSFTLAEIEKGDLHLLIDTIIKRIVGWRGKLLTQAGRMILFKTCIASIPIYLLSFFKFSRWPVDLINSHMANYFWDDYDRRRKLHLANWHLICMKKIIWWAGNT